MKQVARGIELRLVLALIFNLRDMKNKNTFKKLAIDQKGRLIDSSKTTVKRDQPDPLPEFSLKLLLFSYFISLSVLMLFFAFAYLIIKVL